MTTKQIKPRDVEQGAVLRQYSNDGWFIPEDWNVKNGVYYDEGLTLNRAKASARFGIVASQS